MTNLGTSPGFGLKILKQEQSIKSIPLTTNSTIGSQVLAVWCSGNHKQDPFSPVPGEDLFIVSVCMVKGLERLEKGGIEEE